MSVYQVSLLEDQPQGIYRDKHHFCLGLFVVVYKLAISVSMNISVPSFIVSGPTITKLEAQTPFTQVFIA